MEDHFNLAAGVASMVFSKGMENDGVGNKASSNSLIQMFSMAFSTSIPPMESSRESAVAQ
jgi:hypothetical protein